MIGETIQVALVTDDLTDALNELLCGTESPWSISEIGFHNSFFHYRGEETDLSMKLAFASRGAFFWEVIEPTGGRSIHRSSTTRATAVSTTSQLTEAALFMTSEWRH